MLNLGQLRFWFQVFSNLKNMKTGFRDSFKYFKRKNIPPDSEKIVDFNNINNLEDYLKNDIVQVKCEHSDINWVTDFGMKKSSEWEVYKFINKPGLIFIKNPFYACGQRYWIVRSLKYFTRKPSKLNIDPHNIIKSDEDWWEYCQAKNSVNKGEVLQKLRWATFGYHHNWDTKEYSEYSKCDFPLDLKVFCSFIAKELGFSEFTAEAAIINMYHFDSSLSGHTDHSEVNIKAPLFSFSFGQSAVFLIGGQSVEDEVIPILLESGDIVIMSGESRLSYHGVPKILTAKKQPWNVKDKCTDLKFSSSYLINELSNKLFDNEFWKPFEDYVSKSRINMNVRQVLMPEQKTLNS